MIKNISLFLLISFSINDLASQTVTGTWKTIDDQTGKAKSIVEIYENDGKIYGKIIDLINPKQKNPLCSLCDGENKNQPVLGLIIIDGLKKDGDVYEGGTILNPENGKEYKCQLRIEDDKDTLRVRGYVAFFYKTQYWERVN